MSLGWGHTNIDAEFRGAPMPFLQTGFDFDFKKRYTIDYEALLIDLILFSGAVLLVELLARGRSRTPVER